MKYLYSFLVGIVLCDFAKIEAIEIPKENIDPKAIGSKIVPTDLLRSLSIAIISVNPTEAEKVFFPRLEFLALKNLPKPGDYYDSKLIPEFRQTLLKRKSFLDKIDAKKEIDFDLKWGFCKWKAIDSEYNHIAYWSCYRNEVIVSQGTIKQSYVIRTLINWGRDWFVTHL